MPRGEDGWAFYVASGTILSAAVTSCTCSGYCREIVGVLIELNARVT